MEEICHILTDVGYLKAKLAISDFEKVIGGLSYCLLNVSSDFGLLSFHLPLSELNIGQKIRICEKIVFMLEELKCPHSLEPHEIQGLNLRTIFLVLKWIKGLVLEKREEKRKEYERYASFLFRKSRSLCTHYAQSFKYLKLINSIHLDNENIKEYAEYPLDHSEQNEDKEKEDYNSQLIYLNQLNEKLKDCELTPEIKDEFERNKELKDSIQKFKESCEVKFMKLKEEFKLV